MFRSIIICHCIADQRVVCLKYNVTIVCSKVNFQALLYVRSDTFWGLLASWGLLLCLPFILNIWIVSCGNQSDLKPACWVICVFCKAILRSKLCNSIRFHIFEAVTTSAIFSYANPNSSKLSRKLDVIILC